MKTSPVRHWKNYKETYYENILVFKKQNYFENIMCFFSLNKQIMLCFFVKKVGKTESGFLDQKLPESNITYGAF